MLQWTWRHVRGCFGLSWSCAYCLSYYYPFVGLIELVVCLIWFEIIESLGLAVLSHV